ncbi:MAG: hypothetical protein L6V91_06250 [Bacilli bacterium]|nr:MAG: hypothetical protein L6V91_06250 [Bacilli bacterium]
MLQISFCELLPTARRYNNSKKIIHFLFLIGVLFMLIKFIFIEKASADGRSFFKLNILKIY